MKNIWNIYIANLYKNISYITTRDITIHLLSKNAMSSLRPTTCLKTPLGSESRCLTSSDTTCYAPTAHG